ncbi:MAG: glycoside hydrolase family 97 N-terminal domain-containing protein, partial [Bacteroidia bacterium]|nr:glycoside hydrolase family 97 N-terminal domain-containing protein [Bacteroidia bacterium]
MKHICILLLLLFMSVGSTFSAAKKTDGLFKSPDKKVSLLMLNQKGQFFFKVLYHGRVVVEKSPLGLETSLGAFSKELKQTRKITNQLKNESYTMLISKKRHLSVSYREVRISLKNAQSIPLDVVFRVSNDGVAYRYKLYGSGPCTVNRELGGFRFPSSATAFMTPLSVAHSGWARTNPS